MKHTEEVTEFSQTVPIINHLVFNVKSMEKTGDPGFGSEAHFVGVASLKSSLPSGERVRVRGIQKSKILLRALVGFQLFAASDNLPFQGPGQGAPERDGVSRDIELWMSIVASNRFHFLQLLLHVLFAHNGL